MEGKYIFSHDSSLEHYKAEAYALRCFDDRFWKTFKIFLKNMGIKHIDPSSVAGGVKILAEPESETDRDFILREIEKSIRLHKTGKIMLFSHHDCGALGGFERFEGDREKEIDYHRDLHKKAKEIVLEKFPDLSTESYFLDEKGVISIN